LFFVCLFYYTQNEENRNLFLFLFRKKISGVVRYVIQAENDSPDGRAHTGRESRKKLFNYSFVFGHVAKKYGAKGTCDAVHPNA